MTLLRAARVLLLAGALAFLFGAAPASAQSWAVDLYAGGARFNSLPDEVGTTNGAAGIRYMGPQRAWMQATAAAPLQSGDPWWASVGGGRRLATGSARLSLGVDLSAQGQLFRDVDSASTGWSGSLEAMPVISVNSNRVGVELRSGVRHAHSSFLGVESGRTVHDSDLHVDVLSGERFVFGGDARHLRADEGAYSYLGGSAFYDADGTQLWASVGRWLDDALPGTGWAIGAQHEIARGLSLWGSAQRDAGDPVYWNGARTTFNVGATFKLGGAAVSPTNAVNPAQQSGDRVTFTLPLSDASQAPAVGGDFNSWAPIEMTRSSAGWTVTVPIPRGSYHYAFRSPSGQWFVPRWVTPTVDDEFGGRSAVLVVR